MDLQHLTLMEGRSFEEIVRTLSSNNVDYTVRGHPKSSNNYFRDSRIFVNASVEEISDILEDGVESFNSMSYYAYYKINPGFDFKSLARCVVSFDNKGRLIERTTLGCLEPNKPISKDLVISSEDKL